MRSASRLKRSFITKAVYDQLSKESKYSNGTDMWEARALTIKGVKVTLYRSGYSWAV